MQTLMDARVLNAANDVYGERLNKPYTMKRAGNSNDFEFVFKGVTVYRPNHGLAHTLRTACYVPLVAEALGYRFEASAIQNMVIARLFFVSGRENEVSHQENPQQYQSFRETSARLYESYMRNNFKIEDFPENYALCLAIIRSHSGPHEQSPECHILRSCHNLDLLRCYTRNDYQQVVTQYLSNKIHKLAESVEQCLKATGDRICGETNYQDDLFVRCSTNINLCFEKICGVLYPNGYSLMKSAGDRLFIYGKHQEALAVYIAIQNYLKIINQKQDADLNLRFARAYQETHQLSEAKQCFAAINVKDENFGRIVNQYNRLMEQMSLPLAAFRITCDQDLENMLPLLKKLTKLYLKDQSILSDRGLEMISKNLTELTTIDLSNSSGFTKTGLDHLVPNLKSLTHLLVKDKAGRVVNIKEVGTNAI